MASSFGRIATSDETRERVRKIVQKYTSQRSADHSYAVEAACEAYNLGRADAFIEGGAQVTKLLNSFTAAINGDPVAVDALSRETNHAARHWRAVPVTAGMLAVILERSQNEHPVIVIESVARQVLDLDGDG